MAQLVPNDAGYPSLLLVNQAEALAIGRSHGDLLLRNTAVSSRHCTFWRSAGIVYVEDHSTNGTWVDGARIDRQSLHEGQSFVAGDHTFVVRRNR